MSQASVPDEYLCEQCEPRPVDVAFAQAHQQKRKNDEARKALVDRTLKRQSQSSAALTSAAYTYNNGRGDVALEPAADLATGAETLHPSGSGSSPNFHIGRSRKPSQALDLTNTQFVVPEVPASVQSGGRSSAKRKGQKGSRGRSGAPDTPTATTPSRGTMTPGHRDDRHEDPFDTADKLEAWHVEFTPIGKNLVADPSILGPLTAAVLDWQDGSPLRAMPGHSGKMVVPVQRAAVARRRMHSAAARAEETPVTTVEEDAGSASDCLRQQQYQPNPQASSSSSSTDPLADLDYAELGLAAVGHECMPIEMQGPSLPELSARTYVKHISESASAAVFSNVLQINCPADGPQRVWNASRSFSRPVMHGLFADTPIPAGAFICEYRGELYSADAYRKDPINQYAALGAVKPHVHLLPPPLNLAIDARRFGNEGRFARFSCHPNAVLRPILFRRRPTAGGGLRSQDRSRSPTPSIIKAQAMFSATTETEAAPSNDEPELLFGLFAITDISKTHEITLGWEWDDAHIVHFLPELVQNPFLEPREVQTPGGTPRSTFDAERHTANLVAIAERGEFPYASTEFSAKMNAVATALLGCVLCACIGSAAAPGGGSGASANNARKQDCAVAQMLRVGNGMSLLNVVMPGKTNRRAKLPDFAPLVGIRRSWRPLSLPPTPASSAKDAQSPDAHFGDGDAESEAAQLLAAEVLQTDGLEALAQADPANDIPMACGQADGVISGAADADLTMMEDEDNAGSVSLEEPNEQEPLDVQMDDADEVARSFESFDEDADATVSDASSLTDPLSLAGNGASDSEEDEGDSDLRRALRRLAEGKGTDEELLTHSDEESTVDSGHFLLPLKKRLTRTRIKATFSPSLDADSDEEGGLDDASAAAPIERVDVPARLKAKMGLKRKVKTRPSRVSINTASDEEEMDFPRPAKKRKRAGNLADPSSPLSSAPSPGSYNSSLSPPPPVRALYESGDESENSDASVNRQTLPRRAKSRPKAKGKRSARSRPQRGAPEETALERKKKAKARLLRDSIADMGDPESSDDDGTASRVSAQPVESPPTPIKKATKLQRPSREPSVGRKPAQPTVKPPRKEAAGKIKKNRRIVSDTESEEGEIDQMPKPSEGSSTMDAVVSLPIKPNPDQAVIAEVAPASVPATSTAPAPSPVSISTSAPAPAAAPDSAASKATKAASDESPGSPTHVDERISEKPAAAATTPAEVTVVVGAMPPSEAGKGEDPQPSAAPAVKEEPRVKLSLAEYKKRLAERRVSSQAALSQASPSTSPLPATSAPETVTTASTIEVGASGLATKAPAAPTAPIAPTMSTAPAVPPAPNAPNSSTAPAALVAPTASPAPAAPTSPKASVQHSVLPTVGRPPNIPMKPTISAAASVFDSRADLPKRPLPALPKRPSTPPRCLPPSTTIPAEVRSAEVSRSSPFPDGPFPRVAKVGTEPTRADKQNAPVPQLQRPRASVPLVAASKTGDDAPRIDTLPPPPRTPPIKKVGLPPIEGTEASTAAARLTGSAAGPSIGNAAPTLLSRLDVMREAAAATSSEGGDAAGRKMRPAVFQPIGARPASTPGPAPASSSGSWSVIGVSEAGSTATGSSDAAVARPGFVPVVGAGTTSSSQSSPPTHGAGFSRPTMTLISPSSAARPPSLAGTAAASVTNPGGGSAIPGRSFSISSSSSSGGALRQLPPSPGFNPPRAPRAFLSTSTPAVSSGSLTATPSPAPTAGTHAASISGAPVRPAIVSGANAIFAVTPPAAQPGSLATIAVAPPARHQKASMSPPSPALSLNSVPHLNLRDFAGVPTGPASMREREGRNDLLRDVKDRDWEREWSEPRTDRLDRAEIADRVDRDRDRERERIRERDRDRMWEREREPLPFRSGSFDEPLADRLDHAASQPFGLLAGVRGGGRGGGSGGGGFKKDVRDADDITPTSHHLHAASASSGGGGRGFGGRGGGSSGWGPRARGRGGNGRGRGSNGSGSGNGNGNGNGNGGGSGMATGGGGGGWGAAASPPLPPR
ncbi:SET domain-containing protein 3 [Thecaphora frezii]